jgi:hypothetical protein
MVMKFAIAYALSNTPSFFEGVAGQDVGLIPVSHFRVLQ